MNVGVNVVGQVVVDDVRNLAPYSAQSFDGPMGNVEDLGHAQMKWLFYLYLCKVLDCPSLRILDLNGFGWHVLSMGYLKSLSTEVPRANFVEHLIPTKNSPSLNKVPHGDGSNLPPITSDVAVRLLQSRTMRVLQ